MTSRARARLQRRRRKWPATPEAASGFADTAMVTPAVAAPAGAPQWQGFAIEAPDGGECGFALHDFVLPHQALVVDDCACPAFFVAASCYVFLSRAPISSLPLLAGSVRHGQMKSFSRRASAPEFMPTTTPVQNRIRLRRIRGRRSAERRNPTIGRAASTGVAADRCPGAAARHNGGALAFRRFTAVLTEAR